MSVEVAVGSRSGARGSYVGLSVALFLCLFAAHAALLAVSPVLVQLAADLGVSTATAGQLRTISGLAAGVSALAMGWLARRLDLRRLLLGGTALLAVGSITSAGAPSFELLAVAQVPIGVGVALVMAAATAAAAEWAPPEHRARVLSWALSGLAAGWVVGMPVIGAVGAVGWRYGWLALPLLAAIVAGVAIARRPNEPATAPPTSGLVAALADRRIATWALGELLASSAWAGVLVFAGALFTESYDTPLLLTGAFLVPAGLTVIAGNVFFRRFVGCDSRQLLARLALVLAVAVPLLGIVRAGPAVSAGLFAAAGFVAGGRALIGNAFGLELAPERRVAIMGTRTAAHQFGYFVGAAVGGVALSVGGYTVLGLTLGVLFVAAAAPHVVPRRRARSDDALEPVALSECLG